METQKVLPPPAALLLWDKKLSGMPCQPISNFNSELIDLVDLLKSTCYAYNGSGLAAPQINRFQQVAVINYPLDVLPTALINPVLDDIHSKGDESGWEGCLSLPGASAKGNLIQNRARVNRCTKLYYSYYDVDGHRIEAEEDDHYRARIISHEIDHLHGMFYIERTGELSRNQVLSDFRNFVRTQSR